jgi:hypothetical protein
MTQAINWRRVAMVILILAALAILFHVLGAPDYQGGHVLGVGDYHGG